MNTNNSAHSEPHRVERGDTVSDAVCMQLEHPNVGDLTVLKCLTLTTEQQWDPLTTVGSVKPGRDRYTDRYIRYTHFWR